MNTSKAVMQSKGVDMPKFKFLAGVDIPVFLISGGALYWHCMI